MRGVLELENPHSVIKPGTTKLIRVEIQKAFDEDHSEAAYTTGREPLWYIYSKDMNRDADI